MYRQALALFKKSCPALFYAMRRIKRRGAFRQNLGGAEYRAAKALINRHGKIVLNGPFKGMVYPHPGVFEAFLAKMMGSYEKPIHEAVEELIHRKPRMVINVGCAEGYFAVGLAMRLPETEIFAFDIADEPRFYCRETARANGLESRINIQGRADAGSLTPLLGVRAAIVCDCEGFEDELLDPVKIPGLRSTDMLVELHDHLIPGVRERLLSRFGTTHDIELIDDQPRNEGDYTQLESVAKADRAYVIREGRAVQMQWLWMRSRS